MTDLPDLEPVQELKDLRADVAGRAPEEMHRARALLLAEIKTMGTNDDAPRPAFPSRGTSRLRSTSWLLGTAAAAAAVLTVSLLPGPGAQGFGRGLGRRQVTIAPQQSTTLS